MSCPTSLSRATKSSHVAIAPAGVPRRPLRLGLISDTHGVICPEVLLRFQGVDLIVHAGDVGHHGGHQEVLARLRSVAPVYAVRGNVDDVGLDEQADEQADELQVDELQVDELADSQLAVGNLDRGSSQGDGPVQSSGPGGRPGGAEDAVGSEGPGTVAHMPAVALPRHRLLVLDGWRLLVTHVGGQPPDAVDLVAAELVRLLDPHVLIFGHSHKHLTVEHGGRWYLNPGSAGPARFKLQRTAALLELPRRDDTPGSHPQAPLVFTLLHLAAKAPPRLTSSGKRKRKPSRGTEAPGSGTTPPVPAAAASTAGADDPEAAGSAGASAGSSGDGPGPPGGDRSRSRRTDGEAAGKRPGVG